MIKMFNLFLALLNAACVWLDIVNTTYWLVPLNFACAGLCLYLFLFGPEGVWTR